MGEIEDFVKIYIEGSDILEKEVDKISRDLEDTIKDIIGPGEVGYDTGHLHDTVQSDYMMVSGTLGIITAWYSADYGKYWYRWKGGVDFLNEGVNKIVENYR